MFCHCRRMITDHDCVHTYLWRNHHESLFKITEENVQESLGNGESESFNDLCM
jgi:hypothetical protein